nr:NB-ARC domains-containing protein [Tanacetum cinerariifolium]
MGGVGKTTLMKKLKEAAIENKMFKWIPEVVIGKTPNLLSIQKAIAAHIREPLAGTDVTLMATDLSKTFKVRSERKEKILVVLDDVWEKIKLEDIGLASPLPNGVKLLLTSRNVQVCRQIAVDADSVPGVVEVLVLKEEEARMEKLQVIAFDRLEYPVVPTSFQFSANLRTLCLHECSLMFDLTCIGNLSNLEVLSFAYSGITILPSTFGNLKKLRLLDVTGCYNNLVIDDGVLKNMVKLEELYMIAFDDKIFEV